MKEHREKFLEIKKYVCKRCSFKFSSNIKLHQHVHDYYRKKFKSTFFEVFTTNEVFALTFTFKKFVSFLFNQVVLFSKQFFISSFTSFSTLFIILFTFIEFILFVTSFATFFAILKKSIFWAKMTSKIIISSKFSRLSFSIHEFFKNVSISLSIFSSTFLSSTRFYITMNDLFVMFFEKFKSINLQHRQKNKFFSYHW